jgi:hypothetical protein
MAVVGGPVEAVAIQGRLFSVAADSDGARKIGGFEAEVSPNGDGTARIVYSRAPWQMDGLSLAIDDNAADQEFLQDIVEGKKFVPIEFTFCDGITFRGEGIPTGEVAKGTMNATLPLKFNGPGKLEQ